MKLVLVKTNKKLKKQFKINKITLLNFQQRPFQVSLRLIFHMVHYAQSDWSLASNTELHTKLHPPGSLIGQTSNVYPQSADFLIS